MRGATIRDLRILPWPVRRWLICRRYTERGSTAKRQLAWERFQAERRELGQ